MRLLRVKLALFSIATGITFLAVGACLGDLVADNIIFRAIP